MQLSCLVFSFCCEGYHVLHFCQVTYSIARERWACPDSSVCKVNFFLRVVFSEPLTESSSGCRMAEECAGSRRTKMLYFSNNCWPFNPCLEECPSNSSRAGAFGSPFFCRSCSSSLTKIFSTQFLRSDVSIQPLDYPPIAKKERTSSGRSGIVRRGTITTGVRCWQLPKQSNIKWCVQTRQASPLPDELLNAN